MVATVRSVFVDAEAAAGRLGQIRRMLDAAETTAGLAGDGLVPMTLGISRIDATLGGGLGRGALHEITAVREPEIAAASSFALALAIRHHGCAPRRDTIWITEDLALAENGAPYGPGLAETGMAPERLITIAAARGRDVLWAMEEALRCRAVGTVIGELRARTIDPVVTRRLSLAAAAGGTLGLVLRPVPDEAPFAAVTRWIIGAAPSMPARREAKSGSGPPRLIAHLVRNRRGPLGTWIVEWNSVEQRFELAAHPESVAAAVFDRPHCAAVA